MGLFQRLPKRYKETVTIYRVSQGEHERVGTAEAYFSYTRPAVDLGSFSETENIPSVYAIIEVLPAGLKSKDYIQKADSSVYVIEHIHTLHGFSRLQLSEVAG